MVKDIIVVGDLGAGANVVKNLLLLGERHWPLSTDKYKTIKQQYTSELDLSNWIAQEYRLRFWQKFYGLDISDKIDIMKFASRPKFNQPVVYINHSAFYDPEFDCAAEDCEIYYVRPVSQFGLEWQIRAYYEKKAFDNMHDFTFSDQTQRDIYLQTHDHETYQSANATNMKHIVNDRQAKFAQRKDIHTLIELEDLIINNYQKLSRLLEIEQDRCRQILSDWNRLHWPLQETCNWKYHACFS